MKKTFAIILAMLLCCAPLTACGGGNGSSSSGSGLTLDKIKQALTDAGYTVEDEYVNAANKSADVVAGFAVVYDLPGGSTMHTPIMEMKSAEVAKENATAIDGYGYNVCIVNGKFLTMCGAKKGVVEYEAEKTMLESAIKGEPASPPPDLTK